ncbi:hypothetical protein [Dactylosporangium sp. NPDC005555]|uniref:hypothetical protein n=1 Tax=Dactylosporangium sp. NPDC005555 TaxID=3154889 RepID=UPI0033BC21F2
MTASTGGQAWAAQILTRPVPRSLPAAGGEQPPFRAELSSRSHVTFVRSPGSDVGPRPVHTPLTGHNLFLDLDLDLGGSGVDGVTLRSLTADEIGTGPLLADGTSFAMPRSPDLILSPDLEPVAGRAVDAFEPLEIPQYEVLLLRGVPPQARPARDAYGRRLRPAPAGGTGRVVMAVVTDEPDVLHWRLIAEVSQGGRTWRLAWDLAVTARPVMRKFVPGGNGPVDVPVHERFPQHWVPRWPAASVPLPRGGDDPVRLPAVRQVGRVVAADGALTVTVDECEVPQDPDGFPGLPAGSRLWVYSSAGLASVGLTEVTAAVLRTGDAPQDPVHSELVDLIIGMYSAALHQGWRFAVGDVLGFPRPMVIGRAEVAGALIAHAAGDAAWFPAGWPPLLLVLLFEGEREVAGPHGRGRVLGSLAAAQGCFPYPWWFDPDRAPVVDLARYEGSTILGDVATAVHESVLVLDGPGEVAMIVDGGQRAAIAGIWQQVPPRFALIPRYTTMTGRVRVWTPGQSEPREVVAGRPCSRDQAGVHFLLFIQGGDAVTVDQLEDGYVVGLPERDWHAMGAHLRSGAGREWVSSGGTRLKLLFSGG